MSKERTAEDLEKEIDQTLSRWINEYPNQGETLYQLATWGLERQGSYLAELGEHVGKHRNHVAEILRGTRGPTVLKEIRAFSAPEPVETKAP